ncbi:MAG: 50S ribosomal protein L29 [Bacteroidota bacterium]
MKPSEIRDMSAAEIEERIAENQKDLTELRFRRVVAGLEDPLILREKRREIARLKTILNEKSREATAE